MKRLGKIKTLGLAAVAGLALAAPVAIAQTGAQDGQAQKSERGERRHGKGFGRGHRGGGHGFGLRGLNLTEDQQARVRQIHQAAAERTRPLREQLRAKHVELRELQEGGTFNEALATQKLTEAASIQARLMGEQFRAHQEVLSVLTAEQKAQLEQQREQRKQRREQRKNRRGERPGELM